MKQGRYVYRKDTNVDESVECWYKDDQLHREDGPAMITYYDNGRVKIEQWWQNNKIHREDGPAIISYLKNGEIRSKTWRLNDQTHREDGPATISYDVNDGSLRLVGWWCNGRRYRESGPARIYYCGGKVQKEEWFQNGLNGLMHRENEPAEIQYNKDGKIRAKIWRQNGLPHKEDGPALIAYDETGNHTEQKYYLNGVIVPEWFVMTPAGALDPNQFFYSGNIEVRREFVRKIGVERIIDTIGKVIDEKDNYILVNLGINSLAYRPYLKMINPSTGDVHIEGVHPDCETVQQALNWRNGRTDKPVVIT